MNQLRYTVHHPRGLVLLFQFYSLFYIYVFSNMRFRISIIKTRFRISLSSTIVVQRRKKCRNPPYEEALSDDGNDEADSPTSTGDIGRWAPTGEMKTVDLVHRARLLRGAVELPISERTMECRDESLSPSTDRSSYGVDVNGCETEGRRLRKLSGAGEACPTAVVAAALSLRRRRCVIGWWWVFPVLARRFARNFLNCSTVVPPSAASATKASSSMYGLLKLARYQASYRSVVFCGNRTRLTRRGTSTETKVWADTTASDCDVVASCIDE